MKIDAIKDSKVISAINSYITCKRAVVITIAVIAFVAVIITGIEIIRTAQEFIPGTGLSQLDESFNNTLRLNIFKHSIVVFIIMAIGAAFIMLALKIKLEYIYLAVALCLGIAYMLSITPLSGPDEEHHYVASHIIAGHMLFEEDPFNFDSRYLDYRMLAIHHNVPQAYLRLMDDGIYFFRGEAEYIYSENFAETYTLGYPLWYLPQALGLSIARLIGLSFFGAFYLARFFNLLLYVLAVTFSIKRLTAFKLPLFLIGLMPMSLHQAASFSNDPFINAISMLFIAFAIKCIYERDKFHWRDYIGLLVAGVLLAPAKAIYLPIVFIILIVAWKWKEIINAKAWILASSIAVLSMGATFLLYGTATVEMAGEQATNWEGGYNFTMAFVLENPIETFMIFLRTPYHFREWYFYSLLGQFLSGVSLVVPRPYILITFFMLLLAVLYGKRDEWQPKIAHRAIYFVVCSAVVVLCLAAMFFGWTSDWHNVILGVQGRYFIPLMPLALLMLRFKKLLIPYEFFRNGVIVVFLLTQGAIITYVLSYTIGLYS